MKKKLLSIILLSYYSNERIKTAYHKLSKLLNENNVEFEFIIMDDGSTDNSFQVATELESKFLNVRAYQLSKNYTSHYSIFAGLSVCKGNCATVISDDEQQPYEMIMKMYDKWTQGSKIILPYRESRNDGIISNFFANLYYGIINYTSDIRFPKGGADTFFIDREIINILNNKIHPVNTSTITEILRLGFNPVFLPYEREIGVNLKSRWTFKKKYRLFKDSFFSCSTWPIRMITNLGVIFSLFAILFILFYTYIAIWGNTQFWGEKLPGWTSTIIIIGFFSGLILFSLGVIAEYIWRIYEEVKGRPGYIIKNKEDINNDYDKEIS